MCTGSHLILFEYALGGQSYIYVRTIPIVEWFKEEDSILTELVESTTLTKLEVPRDREDLTDPCDDVDKADPVYDPSLGGRKFMRNFTKDQRGSVLPLDRYSCRYSVAAFGDALTYSGQRKSALKNIHDATYAILVQPAARLTYTPEDYISARPKPEGSFEPDEISKQVDIEAPDLYSLARSYIISISLHQYRQGRVHILPHDTCGVFKCTAPTATKMSYQSHLYPFFSQIPGSQIVEREDGRIFRGTYAYRRSEPHSSNSDDTIPGFDGETGIMLSEKNRVTEVIWYS